ncbi:MAG: hypothetical protein KDE58_35130 [Caldilineaceae bacterium]|nr:hypothetical protein [Caldilineaceae bacterium]
MASLPETQQGQGWSTSKLRNTVLLLNGLFLTGMGGAFACFDLWGYYLGGGPLGPILHNLLYTIGFFEAHALACILGLLLLRARRVDPAPMWHWVAAVIHLLLGSANLLFWPLAVQWQAEGPELVVTTLHGLFVIAQLICWWLATGDGRKVE